MDGGRCVRRQAIQAKKVIWPFHLCVGGLALLAVRENFLINE